MKTAERSRVRRPHLLVAVSITAMAPVAAFAQVQSVPDAGTTRGQIEQLPPAPEVRKPEVSVQSSEAFGQDDCSLSQSDVRVTLNEIQYEGVGGAAVDPVLRGLVGSLESSESGDQPISVVCRIRDRVNGELARAGYVARVQVPPQEVTGGVLRLVIVAGRVTEVRVRGDVGRYRSALDSRLEQIRALAPFNKDEAIRILLLANDIPGLKVKLSLRNAGGAPGDLIAEVDAETQDVLLLANVQNFGSRQLGREVATLRGEMYGLTGKADRTYVSLSNSLQWKEIHIAQIGHDFALNDNGLRLAARISLAQSEPDIANLDLQSRSLIAGLEMSQVLVRNLQSSLTATIGGEVLNQATRVLTTGGKVPFTHDQMRVLFWRLDGATRKLSAAGNQLYSADVMLEVRKGVDAFGASKTGIIENNFAPSRFEGVSTATVVRGEASLDLSLGSVLGISGKVFGQWANKPLLNLEEFSVGNYTYGRGYDPGANGGDRAIAVRVEPRIRAGQVGPVDLSFTGFYDVVKLWNLDRSAGTEAKRTLRSAGGGVRMVFRNESTGEARAALDIIYAKPLDKALVADTRKPTGRVLVSLTAKLLPWGSR